MRHLEITPSIQTKLQAAMSGDDLPDFNSIRVYEATAVSTRPVRKAGTLWENAVVTRNTLMQMAEFLNKEGYVPMHISHNQGAGDLPVGRAFYAEVFDLEDGESELRTLFYVPTDEAELVASIENGVLKNLSVGFKPSKMLCSECGWDYLGDDADFINLFDRVCANDHRIGQDGVHMRAAGLDLWMELSLVSVGASKDAEIKSRAKSRLSEDQMRSLAASGRPLESVLFVATTEGEIEMDPKEMVAELKATSGELAVANAALTAKSAELEAAQAELSTAQKRISELEAAASSDDALAELTASKEAAEAAKADAEAKLGEANEASAKTLAFLQGAAKEAMIAAGKDNPAAPETVEECISAIEEAKLSIVQAIPAGGVSAASEAQDVEGKAPPASFSAYKSQS